MSWGCLPNFGLNYNRNEQPPQPTSYVRPFPVNQHFSNAQPPHPNGGQYLSQRYWQQYNNYYYPNYNYDVSYSSRYNTYNNDGGTHASNASRWSAPVPYEYGRYGSRLNNLVNHERVNARQQPNSCDPTPISNEKIPDSRGVKMKKLPFSEVVSSLLEVDIMSSGSVLLHYNFTLKLQERDLLLSNRDRLPYKVKLRLCKCDGSGEHEDYYPTLLQVAVNNNLCRLPGTDSIPRGPTGPVNITLMCNLTGNNDVAVRNADSRKENLRMFIHLVKELTSQDLIDQLKAKNPTKFEDTASQIKEKLQEDQTGNEIASTTFPYSLLCPLSKTRMKLPCRATSCSHFQCFDAITYLQMNELKPKWSCPVCSGPAYYDHLQIDGYFKAVLEQNTSSDKIILLADGSWKPHQSDSKRRQEPIIENIEMSINCTTSTPNRTVVLDSDSDCSNNDCQEIILQDKNQGNRHEIEQNALDDSDSLEVIDQDEDHGFDCEEATELDETQIFDGYEDTEKNTTQDLDCQEIISEDDTNPFDCQEISEQEETREYNRNDSAAKDASASVVTIILSDDESFTNNPQTSNCITGFCSTPRTSMTTRTSFYFQGSPVQSLDTTNTSQSSDVSKRKFRKRQKKSFKTGDSRNSSINHCGISGQSDSVENNDDSHENIDNQSLSDDNFIPLQRSSGQRVSPVRSTMRLRSATRKPKTDTKKRRGSSKII